MFWIGGRLQEVVAHGGSTVWCVRFVVMSATNII